MKKWMKMTATMMVAAMALTACGGNDAADDSADAGETYTVGIIQQLEHPALDQATKGFEDKLTELLGDKVKFDYQNAQGEQTNCTTIATKFVSNDVDLIMANATTALQAAAAATGDIPVSYTHLDVYKRQEKELVFLCNFTPVVHRGFSLGVPQEGVYHERLNSDAARFGGSDVINAVPLQSKAEPAGRCPFRVELDVPPLGMVILEREDVYKRQELTRLWSRLPLQAIFISFWQRWRKLPMTYISAPAVSARPRF